MNGTSIERTSFYAFVKPQEKKKSLTAINCFSQDASSSFPLRTPAKHLITDTKQPAKPNDTIWQNAPQPSGPVLSKKPSRVLNWKWSYDLSRRVIRVFSGLFLLSSPLWRLSVNTHWLFQRFGLWLGPPDPAGTEKTSHPLPFTATISSSLARPRPKLGTLNTLVKPAGLKAYVSLPSTCIRVQASPVCTHRLVHEECLPLQDVKLQQETGSNACRGEGKEAITEASYFYVYKSFYCSNH